MKQLLIVFLLSLPLAIFAQNQSIAKFYAKYKDYKNVTNINLEGWGLKLATNFSKDKDTKEGLRQVTKLNVMIMENGNIVARTDVKQLLKNVRQDKFEELMSFREGKSTISILIKEKKEAITNLLVVVNGEKDFILLNIEGWLNFSDLSKLNIDIEGGKYLKKIPKSRPRA